MSEPERWPLHYGDHYVGGEMAQRKTIHDSGVIDVVIDPRTREVREVWFRCLNLPFRVSEQACDEMQPDITVTAVQYLEWRCADGCCRPD